MKLRHKWASFHGLKWKPFGQTWQHEQAFWSHDDGLGPIWLNFDTKMKLLTWVLNDMDECKIDEIDNIVQINLIESSWLCRDPSFGLATKARACKKVRQEGDPGGTSYTPGSAWVWENEPSHSQGNSHLGSWSPKGLPKL